MVPLTKAQFSTCSNETEILSLLYTYGPLIAGVDATVWNEYLGGIIQYNCGTIINHAVQIVGYDITGMSYYHPSTPYKGEGCLFANDHVWKWLVASHIVQAMV